MRKALLPPGWLRDHFLQSIFLPWMCTKNSSSAVASDADPRPPLPMSVASPSSRRLALAAPEGRRSGIARMGVISGRPLK
jgi:hypothetical protein